MIELIIQKYPCGYLIFDLFLLFGATNRCSLNASGTGGSGLHLQLQLYGQLSNKGMRAVDALDIVLCKVRRV